jgi:hypothetical protein
VLLDQYTQEYVLMAPTHEFVSFTFPAVADLSIYARCASVQGSYQLELQLQDLEGTVVWRDPLEAPLECGDPLLIGILNLQHRGIFFPRPGKYELVLLANGDEVVRDVFFARLHNQPLP